MRTEKSFSIDAEVLPVLMLRMFQKETAMTIPLRMRRARATKATPLTTPPAPTTEPTQMTITLISKITKHLQVRSEAENRRSIHGVERRSPLVEEIPIIILRRYKNIIFVLRHLKILSSIFCVLNRHVDVIYCTSRYGIKSKILAIQQIVSLYSKHIPCIFSSPLSNAYISLATQS